MLEKKESKTQQINERYLCNFELLLDDSRGGSLTLRPERNAHPIF